MKKRLPLARAARWRRAHRRQRASTGRNFSEAAGFILPHRRPSFGLPRVLETRTRYAQPVPEKAVVAAIERAITDFDTPGGGRLY